MTTSAAPDGELPNLGLLIKLLKMTTSSVDSEALAAARMANAQLAKFGGDWEALLRGKVTVIGDPFADMPAPPKKEATPPPRAYARPTPPPPPNAYQRGVPPRPGQQTATQARSTYTPPPRRPAKPQIGPSGGKTRSNLFSGTCLKCNNFVAEQDGFSLKDTSWNTTSKWQVCCNPCFYANAPAGYTSGRAKVTNIDLDSLA